MRKVKHNPYAGIDWATIERHRANFHTHTTYSDGSMDPHVVIDKYAQLDHVDATGDPYSILSLADHDTMKGSPPHNTYPWTNLNGLNSDWENRDPDALGMVAVEGEEPSAVRHIAIHFSDYNAEGEDNEATIFQGVQDAGGLAHFVHPGRYVEPDNTTDIAWYVDHYKNFPDVLVGMEVYNQVDRYPDDRDFWDGCLAAILPERVIWAFANDDMHTTDHLFCGWQDFLLTELTPQNVKDCYAAGRFFVFSRETQAAPHPPQINSVDVSGTTITLDASDYDSIEWISDGDVVGNDLSIDVAYINGKYVRAKLYRTSSDESRTLTQPFTLEPVTDFELQAYTPPAWDVVNFELAEAEVEPPPVTARWAMGTLTAPSGGGTLTAVQGPATEEITP